ncbi:T9SS type A sorting domain-containing protein [candidate division KSB1 bacterium]|nr:T9SS type A sorting domain-containing protein [candidate division KSB1 bacterium]
MKVYSVFLMLLIELLMTSQGTSQEVVDSPEFIVNTDTQTRKGIPAISALKAGDFLICWESNLQDGDEYGIFGQIFDTQHQKVGNEFQINNSSLGSQTVPKIVSLPDGDILIGWVSRIPGQGRIIKGQLFDAAMQRKGVEFQMNTNTSPYSYLDVAPFSNNSFICCWPFFLERTFVTGIAGQRFSATGTKIGNEFQVNSEAELDTVVAGPAIIPLRNNEFMVYWVCDKRFYSAQREIWEIQGQRFDSSGNKQATEFRLETNSMPYFSSLDFFNLEAIKFLDQNALLSWKGYLQTDQNHRSDFFYVKFDPVGQRLGDECPGFRTEAPKSSLAIAAFADGSIFMCCEEAFLYDSRFLEHRLTGQWLDAAGQKIGSIFQITDRDGETEYYYPCVLSHQDREVVIGYQKISGSISSRFSNIGAKIIPRPKVYSLEPFDLLEPQNDATVTSIRPTFKWRQPAAIKKFYPFEITYTLFLDTNPNFPHPNIFYDVTDTCFSPSKVDSLEAGRTYFWKILTKNIGNDSLWCNQSTWGFFVKRGASAIRTLWPGQLPVRSSLAQNYPNPFNATTTIHFDLYKAGKAELKVLDLAGKDVVTLIHRELPAGVHQVVFDAQSLASGVYFYQLRTSEFSQTRKLLLVK